MIASCGGFAYYSISGADCLLFFTDSLSMKEKDGLLAVCVLKPTGNENL